jgi:hypothetical protein
MTVESRLVWSGESERYSGVVRTCLDFLANTLPLSDLDTYSFDLFLSFAQQAAKLRETVPWCAGLEEEKFLQYVLYPRVNDENISPHREAFFLALWPRVEKLSGEQAALETNIWCAEHALYAPQDDRTASPWAVYRNGVGRCGELSVFLVSALRAIGLAARQIYVPRWSHCDDNHAWVEVFLNGGWHFMGACEPEPCLDRGWFNLSATQAVLVHSRTFGAPDSQEEEISKENGVRFYNQTARYAPTRRVVFTVSDNGVPVPDVPITLSILNEAKWGTIAKLKTDKNGTARIQMGGGSVFISAVGRNTRAEKIFHADESEICAIALKAPVMHEWMDFEFHCPRASATYALSLSPEQKKRRKDICQSVTTQRFLAQSKKTRPEIARFLEADANPLRSILLEVLNEKDLRDISSEILEDHLMGAAPHAKEFLSEIFNRYLLCPRIATENLSAWRQILFDAYDESQRREAVNDPPKFWKSLCASFHMESFHMGKEGSRLHSGLFWPPEVANLNERCDWKSLRVLFVALLRSFGLPARLNPLDGQTPEFWCAGNFEPVEKYGCGVLQLYNPENVPLSYAQNWSLSKRTADEWLALRVTQPWESGALILPLPVGEYSLITSARMPNGSQLASRFLYEICDGKETRIDMRVRVPQTQDMLYKQILPANFPFKRASDKITILIWVEPDEEPSVHLLREMKAQQTAFQAMNVDIRIMISASGKHMNTGLFSSISSSISSEDGGQMLRCLTDCLGLDPERLPVVVLIDKGGCAVYDFCGYQVGCANLILRIVYCLNS